MRALLSSIATLLIVAETGAGCGGGGGGTGPTGVLTTVEVTPASATRFTVAPGNTVTLAVVGKDQDGQTMSGLGSPSFSSDNSAIASVSDAGTITALAAGTARITASLTAGGVTKSGTATMTAQVAPANAGVAAPAMAFTPALVDIQLGGSVMWGFGSVPHNVVFTTSGAPANVPDLQDGSASRAFPSHGTFAYHCTIHPGMTGTVNVH